MNKKCLIILKGYELLQEIANGKIKEGTKFRDLTGSSYENESNIYRYENENFTGRWGETNILKLLNHDFEILEDEEIDIQAIEKVSEGAIYKTEDIIDTLIGAVRYLDKKINKED